MRYALIKVRIWINVDFLFYDVLIKHLFKKFERLCVHHSVVKTFPDWFYNVILFVEIILLSLFAWTDHFLFEFELVFERIVHVLNKTFSWGSKVSFDPFIVEPFHFRVKYVSVIFSSLYFQLKLKQIKLFLDVINLFVPFRIHVLQVSWLIRF